MVLSFFQAYEDAGSCDRMSAHLCHVYGVKQEWLDAGKSCPDFTEKYCINRDCGGLRRIGKPTMPGTKGSIFKSPLHLPRCLIPVDQMTEEILG